MEKLLNVAMAGRFVGVSRGSLQKKIMSGELITFEGMLKVSDLQRMFPEVDAQQNTYIEKLEQIKSKAAQKARGSTRPTLNVEILTDHIRFIKKEFIKTKTQMVQFAFAINQLKIIISNLKDKPDNLLSENVEQLHQWVKDKIQPIEINYEKDEQSYINEDFVRIMTCQVQVQPDQISFPIIASESIAEASQHANTSLPPVCSDGKCGKCKAKVISGDVSKIRYHPDLLTPEEEKENYIITCANTAVTDITIEI